MTNGPKRIPSDAQEVRVIGPCEAKEILERDAKSNVRVLNQNHVRRLAHDMRTGGWYWNGDPLRFCNRTFRLLDGQHRLTALVEAGVELPFSCAYIENSEQTVATIDTGGMKRSLSQLLRRKGAERFQVASPVARWLCIVDNAGKESITWVASGPRRASGGTNPTTIDLLRIYDEQRDVIDWSTALGEKSHSTLLVSPSAVAVACIMAAREVGKEVVEEFISNLTSPRPGALANLVIQTIHRERTAQARKGGWVHARWVYVIMLRALHYYWSGLSPSRFTMKRLKAGNLAPPDPKRLFAKTAHDGDPRRRLGDAI